MQLLKSLKPSYVIILFRSQLQLQKHYNFAMENLARAWYYNNCNNNYKLNYLIQQMTIDWCCCITVILVLKACIC